MFLKKFEYRENCVVAEFTNAPLRARKRIHVGRDSFVLAVELYCDYGLDEEDISDELRARGFSCWDARQSARLAILAFPYWVE